MVKVKRACSDKLFMHMQFSISVVFANLNWQHWTSRTVIDLQKSSDDRGLNISFASDMNASLLSIVKALGS